MREAGFTEQRIPPASNGGRITGRCTTGATMKEWLKPEITESEAGMEVTSYLPAELDRA
jgi:coenzyme PQQ precursor peptide PqqA